MSNKSIYAMTYDQLEQWLTDHDQRRFRVDQVWNWLYVKRVNAFSEMKNVNKETIALLEENFVLHTTSEALRQESEDGTVKYLFRLADGNLIETVLMRFHYGLSVCVTTQVGCRVGCSFCASGLLRKNRDLDSSEIVEQIMNVQRDLDNQANDERVSHIVVMGIGEPFDNFNNLMDFISVVNHDAGLNIGARHITVSTSGLAHKIYRWADTGTQVNLAISLHAPNNELRSSIMQINKAFPIEKLMDAVDYYMERVNRRVTYEYIMLKGVNDHKEDAQELVNLLADKRRMSYVNLIPYNEVSELDQYERSDSSTIQAFFETLQENGINCGVRWENGADIDAACGQLRSRQVKAKPAK